MAGLLLIGVVADEDGLFASAGQRLARVASSVVVLFAGAAGTRPSITKAARLGIVAVPLAMVMALGTLALSGSG